MPIYEYRCECGATLESIERVGSERKTCADLCVSKKHEAGTGRVERVMSLGLIRGDGHEAKEPTFDPCARSNRPGGGCGGDEY